jgi:hypothetical protein
MLQPARASPAQCVSSTACHCPQVELDSIDKRKVWMKAQVTDGGKATYATAKSLFVAPRPLNLIRNMLFGWVPGLGSKPRPPQAVQPLATA